LPEKAISSENPISSEKTDLPEKEVILAETSVENLKPEIQNQSQPQNEAQLKNTTTLAQNLSINRDSHSTSVPNQASDLTSPIQKMNEINDPILEAEEKSNTTNKTVLDGNKAKDIEVILDKSESKEKVSLQTEITKPKDEEIILQAEIIKSETEKIDVAPTTEPQKNEESESKKKLTKKEREEANKKRKEERKKAKAEKEKKRKEAKKKADEEKRKLIRPSIRQKWNYQLQLTGSGIFSTHSLSESGQIESAYLSNSDQYVSSAVGYGTEMRFITESPMGLLFTAGIQYQQLNEQLIRQETILESKVKEIPETITEDVEGNIINATYTEQLVTTSTTYNQQLYNQYHFVNIPIGVGYAFKVRNMRLKLVGGIDVNAYFKFSGSMFNRSLEIIDLESEAKVSYNRIYKDVAGLGVWASVEWHQPLNERLSLVVTPGFQAPLGSISQDNEAWPISHKVLNMRLGAGINYLFGNDKKPKSRGRKE